MTPSKFFSQEAGCSLTNFLCVMWFYSPKYVHTDNIYILCIFWKIAPIIILLLPILYFLIYKCRSLKIYLFVIISLRDAKGYYIGVYSPRVIFALFHLKTISICSNFVPKWLHFYSKPFKTEKNWPSLISSTDNGGQRNGRSENKKFPLSVIFLNLYY